MTKTKTTKRALFASVLSLLVCVSMLIGSTFAWFTDTASTAVNSIQSGTIDIRLVDPFTGNSLEGKSISFVDKNGNTDILWEPGATFVSQPVRVMNHSNLSFYLDVFISGFEGDLKLLEAIDFKIVYYSSIVEGYTWDQLNGRGHLVAGTGTSLTGEGKNGNNWMANVYGTQADWTGKDEYLGGYVGVAVDPSALGVGSAKPLMDICIVGHMKEEAGNEYQGLTLSGAGLTFSATQAPYENDSYEYTYDKDAEWAVVSPEALDEALADTTKNNIVVGGGKYTSTVKVPSGKNLTTDAGTFDTRDNTNYEVPVVLSAGSALAINDGTFMGSRYIMQIISVNDGTLEVNEGTFTGGALAWVNANSDIVINGGTFSVTGLFVCDDAKGMKPVEINGGEFTLGKQGFNYNNPSIAIVINGGTFNVDPSAYVGEGHSVVKNNNGTWTVQ